MQTTRRPRAAAAEDRRARAAARRGRPRCASRAPRACRPRRAGTCRGRRAARPRRPRSAPAAAPTAAGVKCRPAVGAAALPGQARVDRLVALVGHRRIVHVRRQRHAPRLLERALAASSPASDGRTSQRPSPSASTGSIASSPGLRGDADARPHAARGPHERLPEAVARAPRAAAPPRPRRSAGARRCGRAARGCCWRPRDRPGRADRRARRSAGARSSRRAGARAGARRPGARRAAARSAPRAARSRARRSARGQSRRRRASPGERDQVIGAATDEALVRRAAAGQREAFEELVRRHRARVLRARAAHLPQPRRRRGRAAGDVHRRLPRAAALRPARARLDLALPHRDEQVLRRARPAPRRRSTPTALPEPADPHDPFARSERQELLDAGARRAAASSSARRRSCATSAA